MSLHLHIGKQALVEQVSGTDTFWTIETVTPVGVHLYLTSDQKIELTIRYGTNTQLYVFPDHEWISIN